MSWGCIGTTAAEPSPASQLKACLDCSQNLGVLFLAFRDFVAVRNQSRALLNKSAELNKSSRSSLAARLKFPFSQNKD